jgi:hypothetical protein
MLDYSNQNFAPQNKSDLGPPRTGRLKPSRHRKVTPESFLGVLVSAQFHSTTRPIEYVIIGV